MFRLDKYRNTMPDDVCEFIQGSESGMKGEDPSRMVTAKGEYIKIFENCIKSRDNPGIAEKTSDKEMSLRLRIIGQFKDKITNDNDLEKVFNSVSSNLPESFPKFASLFVAEDAFCYHFPHKIEKKDYLKLSKDILQGLNRDFKNVDTKNVDFVGLNDNSYPILLPESKGNVGPRFKCSFPGFLSLTETIDKCNFSPERHPLFTSSNFNKVMLSSLLFSPKYSDEGSGEARSSSSDDSFSEVSIPDESHLETEVENDSKQEIENNITAVNETERIVEGELEMEKFLPKDPSIFDPNRSSKDADGELGEFEGIWNKATNNVNFRNIVDMVNRSDKTSDDKRLTNIVGLEFAHDLPIDTLEPRGMAVYLLPMINPARFLNDHNREEIGSGIKNSFKEDKREGLSWYIQYNAKVGRTDIEKLKVEYENLKDEYSVLTLAHYAKIDDPLSYNTWKSVCLYEDTQEIVKDPNDASIAKFIYRLNMLDYMFLDKRWYVLNTDTCSLEETSSGWVSEFVIRKVLSKNFRWQISPTEYKTLEEIENAPGDCGASDFHLNICTVVRKLKGGRAVKDLIPILETLFKCKVKKGFNQDREKTAWLNCVTVATSKDLRFERPKLEDMITKSTKIRIAENKDTEEYRILENYIKEVFPEGLDKSFMVDTAGLLRGEPEKKLKVYTGNGNNSKSFLLILMEHVLGDYYHSIDISAIKGGNGENATPFLADASCCRLLTINDPDPGSVLGMAFIKAATGQDNINMRRMRENGHKEKASYRICLACNAIPQLSNADVAGSDRFLVFPFLGKWVDNPNDPENKKHKYLRKKDPAFKDILPRLAPYMARMMVDLYPEYVKDVQKCERYKHHLIVRETKRQWTNVCPFLKMFHDKYIEDETGEFTIFELRKKFNRSVQRQHRIENDEWFVHQIENMGLKKKEGEEGVYLGWRLDDADTNPFGGMGFGS